MSIVLDTRLIDVETDGRVLNGIAVPYDRPSLVADAKGPGGAVRIYAEVWDGDSIRLPDGPIPLLTSHDESRPVGRIGHGGLWHERDGLHVEATLSGSASEVDGIIARARDGVMGGLSVGFLGGGRADVWTSPSTPGGVPTVLRRNAQLRELSLVVWPALAGAQVHRVSAYTRGGAELAERLRREREEQHSRSQAFIAAHQPRTTPQAPAASAPEPTRPTKPRPFQLDPVSYAPLQHDDPTDLERQLHQRALWNWANDLVRRDRAI
jgi:HK97 family phage prohead protease